MRISSRHFNKVFKRRGCDWGSWKMGGKQRKLKQAHNIAMRQMREEDIPGYEIGVDLILNRIKGTNDGTEQHT